MTKQFIWNDKYSVNVPALDAQHKRFFEITNQILNVLDNPIYSNKVDPTNTSLLDLKKQLVLLIVELGNYALKHLSYEEDCMKSHNCSGCTTHAEVHDMYREKVTAYLKAVTTADTDIFLLAKEVAVFSQDWLSKHILSRDREYIGCLTKDNVK